MAGFKELHNEDFVILSSKGNYRQCVLATLPGGGLYAKVGSSYVRLYSTGATSNQNLRIVRLEMVGELYEDVHARLATLRETLSEKRTPLTHEKRQALDKQE